MRKWFLAVTAEQGLCFALPATIHVAPAEVNIAERSAGGEGAKLNDLTGGRGLCCQERSSSRLAFDA